MKFVRSHGSMSAQLVKFKWNSGCIHDYDSENKSYYVEFDNLPPGEVGRISLLDSFFNLSVCKSWWIKERYLDAV